MSFNFPKTLAIDVGVRKLGLAVSYASLAEPLLVLPNDQNALSSIGQIVIKEAVEQVLVGISEGKSADLARQFASSLEEYIDLPIFFADETLSTKSALEKIRQTKGKAYRGDDDHMAAAVFLQDWIDSEMSS